MEHRERRAKRDSPNPKKNPAGRAVPSSGDVLRTENPVSRINTQAPNLAVPFDSDTNPKYADDEPHGKSQHVLTSRPKFESAKKSRTRGMQPESQEPTPNMKSFDTSTNPNRSSRRKDELRLANPSLRNIDDPANKQGTLPIQTNVLNPISTAVVYLCKISCKPENLTKDERQWLIKGLFDHYSIRPHNGRMMFLDSQSFLTTDSDFQLEQSVYLGLLHREVSKIDTKSKPIHFNHGPAGQQCMWSRLTKGRKLKKTPSILRIDTIRLKGDGSPQTFEAYASISSERLNVIDFCTSNLKNQGTCVLNKSTSVIDRLLSAYTNTALGAASQNQPVVHGGKTFDFGQAGCPLEFGLEARNGALSIVRATEKGLVRVVNPYQQIFFSPIRMSDFMTAHWLDHTSSPVKASAHMTSILRGLRIIIRQANGVERLATVSGVASTCSRDTFFKLTKGKSATRISVEDYFTKEHGVLLTRSTLPCLIVGSTERPQYFPSCMCDIRPGQSFRNKVPLQAEANLHRFKKLVESSCKDKDNKSLFEDSADLIESPSSKRSSKIPSSLIPNTRRSAKPPTTIPLEPTAPECQHRFISPVSPRSARCCSYAKRRAQHRAKHTPSSRSTGASRVHCIIYEASRTMRLEEF